MTTDFLVLIVCAVVLVGSFVVMVRAKRKISIYTKRRPFDLQSELGAIREVKFGNWSFCGLLTRFDIDRNIEKNESKVIVEFESTRVQEFLQ